MKTPIRINAKRFVKNNLTARQVYQSQADQEDCCGAAYLQEERTEVEAEIKRVNAELNTLGKRRMENLTFLSATNAFDKYKQFSDEMVTLSDGVCRQGRSL